MCLRKGGCFEEKEELVQPRRILNDLIRIQSVFCRQKRAKAFEKRMENDIFSTTSGLPTILPYNFITVSFSHFKQKNRTEFISINICNTYFCF